MDGWIVGWMDGRMDGWKDDRLKKQTERKQGFFTRFSEKLQSHFLACSLVTNKHCCFLTCFIEIIFMF